MDNFPIMNMFDGQANLGEPVQDLVLAEITSFGVFNLTTQIPSICIIHENIKCPALDVSLQTFDDIGVVESF